MWLIFSPPNGYYRNLLIPCSQYNTSILDGIGNFRLAICFNNVVLPILKQTHKPINILFLINFQVCYLPIRAYQTISTAVHNRKASVDEQIFSLRRNIETFHLKKWPYLLNRKATFRKQNFYLDVHGMFQLLKLCSSLGPCRNGKLIAKIQSGTNTVRNPVHIRCRHREKSYKKNELIFTDNRPINDLWSQRNGKLNWTRCAMSRTRGRVLQRRHCHKQSVALTTLCAHSWLRSKHSFGSGGRSLFALLNTTP